MSNGFLLVVFDDNNSNVQQNLNQRNCSHKLFMCCKKATGLLRRPYALRRSCGTFKHT
jgi:hypothetical protein